MQKNKTIYFPATESGTGKSERLSFSTVRIQSEGFLQWLSPLKAEQIRYAIGRSFSSLQEEASVKATTISTIVIAHLMNAWQTDTLLVGNRNPRTIEQLNLFANDAPPDQRQLGRNGTFSTSRELPIQRWYPYLEGFSEDFADGYFSEFCGERHSSIFDPFCGSGTTAIAALKRRWSVSFCEVNPFMVEVIRIKTEVVPRIISQRIDLYGEANRVVSLTERRIKDLEVCKKIFSDCFSDRPYFMDKQLQEIISLKTAIEDTPPGDLADVLKFALSCVALQCSNLKRAGDVRYRRENEALPPSHSVIADFLHKVEQIAEDAPLAHSIFSERPQLLAPSALALPPHTAHSFKNKYDLVFTSPPYLNGTNYIRNTKLELWIMGFIQSERDLTPLRKAAVTAGISDVFKDNRKLSQLDWIEDVACTLDSRGYDKRIPLMIRSYMSDAQIWVKNAAEMLKPGAHLLIDIGDSIFAGVHVPTVEWLAKTCEIQGLKVDEIRLIRKRKSKDGSPLKQSMIVTSKRHLKAPRPASIASAPAPERSSIIKRFASDLPYRTEPYSSRNWGHPLHSLCSYQGKLKPALAHFLVKEFTTKGDAVLDPLSGAGTIPLECLLQGRVPLANDLQELAFLLSIAKSTTGKRVDVERSLEVFLSRIEHEAPLESIDNFSSFGFNGKLPDYFHPQNYREILCGRKILAQIIAGGRVAWEDAVVLSCWLHILHGNRPYALSRRSHPVTPFKPTGEFEYRDLASRMRDKVSRTMNAFDGINRQKHIAKVSLGDFNALELQEKIDCVITSPPFANSTRFYITNWMRLWAAGWAPDDFKLRPAKFIETKQKKNFSVYEVFLHKCRSWLKSGGLVVMHLGKTKISSMADSIATFSESTGFKVIGKFDESVADCENFGVSDQGATTAHEFLIMEKY